MTPQNITMWLCLLFAVGVSALGQFLGGTFATVSHFLAFALTALFLCKPSFWNNWDNHKWVPTSMRNMVLFAALSVPAWHYGWWGVLVVTGLVTLVGGAILTLAILTGVIFFAKDFVLWANGSRPRLEFGRSFAEKFPAEQPRRAEAPRAPERVEVVKVVEAPVAPPPVKERTKSRFELIDE